MNHAGGLFAEGLGRFRPAMLRTDPVDLAMEIFGHFEKTVGFAPSRSVGGGSALMLQIDYRESHDIDIFLDES